MTEEEIRRDERAKIIRVLESTNDYYTSACSGYTEKEDIKSHMKRTLIDAVRRIT